MALLFLTDFARSRFSRESSGQPRKWGTLARVALFSLPLLWVQTQQSLAQCPPTCGFAYTVDSTGDGDNVPPNGTACNDGTNHCTLRAAIEAANARAGDDGIFFDIPTTDPGFNSTTGDYQITLNKAPPDLSTNILITGPGVDKLLVQHAVFASTRFRIFNVTTTGTVTLSGLTIRDGVVFNESGAGIQNFSTGTVNVTNCRVQANVASGNPGPGKIRRRHLQRQHRHSQCHQLHDRRQSVCRWRRRRHLQQQHRHSECHQPPDQRQSVLSSATAAAFTTAPERSTSPAARSAVTVRSPLAAVYSTTLARVTISNSTFSGNLSSACQACRAGQAWRRYLQRAHGDCYQQHVLRQTMRPVVILLIRGAGEGGAIYSGSSTKHSQRH